MAKSNRQTELAVDLGDEEVELIRLEAVEALSQHFTISLDLLMDRQVDLLPHLGKPVAVSVSEDGHLLRYFNGIAIDAEMIQEIESVGFIYRMTLRPLAYLHSQGRDYKIFQNKTTKDIIQKILADAGIEVEFNLSGSTPNRAYCVQYGESNFGFVSRLMEEDGLYYYYFHADSDHVLMICDSPSAHSESAASPLVYNPFSGSGANVDSPTGSSDDSMYVQSWHERVSTGAENKVTLRDFDFMKPDKAREAETALESAHKVDSVEVYDFPGRYFTEDVLEQRTTALLQARRANRRTYSGTSHNAALAVGATFVLSGHSSRNGSYLITHAHHSVAAEHQRSGMAAESGNTVSFEAVPAETKWRAPLTARRPVVLGPETAIVTGPKDETIYTDKFGRIKVKFHWDRVGKYDENSSCWIRVSQTGGLGNNILPRVGHEVIVDFLHGDPDRPIIVGRVFNQDYMPVYELPAHRTKAVWRTLTYGTPVDAQAKEQLDTKSPLANELRFEDKAGAEEVFLHSQRDMNVRTIRTQTNHLGLDQDTKIGQHRTIKIGVDDSVKIGNNRLTEIKSNEDRKIGANRKTKIDSNDSLDVGQTIKIDAGMEIVISAGTKMTLKVGGSTITLDPTKIDINTMMLTMNGSIMAELKSTLTTVKGSAITTVQGGLVKIN